MAGLLESMTLLVAGGAVTFVGQSLVGQRKELVDRLTRLEEKVHTQQRDIAITRALAESLRRRASETVKEEDP